MTASRFWFAETLVPPKLWHNRLLPMLRGDFNLARHPNDVCADNFIRKRLSIARLSGRSAWHTVRLEICLCLLQGEACENKLRHRRAVDRTDNGAPSQAILARLDMCDVKYAEVHSLYVLSSWKTLALSVPRVCSGREASDPSSTGCTNPGVNPKYIPAAV